MKKTDLRMEELLGELVEDDSTAASIGLYGRKKENYEHTKKNCELPHPIGSHRPASYLNDATHHVASSNRLKR